MKKRIFVCFLALVLLFSFPIAPVASAATASVVVVDANTAVNALLGDGVTATNISFTGAASQLGIFSFTPGILPLSDGIAISTGSVTGCVSTSATPFGTNGSGITHADLTQLAGYETNDSAVLQFDVTPNSEEFSFSFFFMSGEYDQNPQFNDVFALWVYDPRVGLEKTKVFPSAENGLNHYNTARLPNGDTVTISNTRGPYNGVSIPTNMPYATEIKDAYLNGLNVRANGYTQKFYADAGSLLDGNGNKLVQPGRTLRVCIAIADVSDTSVNSVVFIGANSVKFEAPPEVDETPTPVPVPTPVPEPETDEHLDTHCIDYSKPDLIVPGSASGFEINLTKETLTIPETYTPELYSIDGGNRWRKVNTALTPEKFPKFLNKDTQIVLSDKPIDKATRKPEEDAKLVEFPKINKRPKAEKLVFNYLIGEDPTGDTLGQWVLTQKEGTTAVKENLQIGVGDPTQKYKVVNELGFGYFYEGETKGICVRPMLNGKPQKLVYLIRTAPAKQGEEYTAASKPKKIKALGALKAPKAKIKTKNEKLNKDGSVKKPASATIAVKKGTYVKMNGEVKFYSDKATIDVLGYSGNVEIWTGATVKKPVSTKLCFTR